MFTAEEAGAVLGRDLWSEGPSQLSGGGPTNVVAHLFAYQVSFILFHLNGIVDT